ncbi:MAG: hypothetical protein ACI8UR_001712 [Natronomonas sp.]|jgi:hypothetical protein|uniref:hypothetical protein n=1 Tax=Natronomonas sp. TaxID=2184060 RepID=UPI003988FB71
MDDNSAGSSPREISAFIFPGAVGIGVGIFIGLFVADSAVVAGALALLCGLAGHAAGYLVLENQLS